MVNPRRSLPADDVAATDELDRRPSRAPDHEAESRALRGLAETLASRPDGVFQHLVEAAMALTRADSVGISLLEPGGEHGTVRWVAATGAWAPYLNGRMPREASPCGEVIARDAVLLMREPERALPALGQARPGVHEGLLAPFHVAGEAAGTVWAIKHTPDGRFEREDARVLRNLAAFAAAAHRTVRALGVARTSERDLAGRVGRQTAALRESEDRLARALEAGGIGAWELDLLTLEAWRSPRHDRIFGYETPLPEWTYDAFLRHVAPEDRGWVDARFQEALAGGGRWHFECRIRRADGEVRWIEARGGVDPDAEGRRRRMKGTVRDITDGKRIEAALKESEERQAFLLTLSDALRPLADPEEIKLTAARMLGRRLGACRVGYAENVDDEHCDISRNYVDGAREIVGRARYADYGPGIAADMQAGRNRVWPDIRNDPRFSEAQKRALAEADVGALLNVPLVKDGRLVAFLGVNYPAAHDFRPGEVAFIADVAERTWAAVERARAEAAIRESEARYRTLFESIAEGFCIVETVKDANGRVTDLIYREANEAYAKQAGFRPHPGLRMREIAPGIEEDWIAYYDRVSSTGVAETKESFNADLKRWYRTQCSRIGPAGSPLLGFVFEDVTRRKLAERVLRESEARQAFLLKLSDVLRPLAEPVEIIGAATRLLGEGLGASRAYYAEWPPGTDYVEIRRDHAAPGLPSLVGRYPIEAFRSTDDRIREGRTWVVEDAADGTIAAAERDYCLAHGVAAWVDVPLVKGGELQAALFLVQDAPRRWNATEIALAEETAERTWAAVERARTEAALRASEERFARFANASAAGLWMRDAATLAMEYASPAVGAIYGVASGALLGDVARWAGLIVPEDREAALAHLDGARRGEAAVHEFRIQRPSDRSFRWIRHTDFPLRDGGHVQRIGGIAEDVTEAKLNIEHQAVLLAELQHRVRNIMAVIRSITARTGERAASVPEYAALMAGRLLTLARVQALLTRGANVGVGIRTVVEDELGAQAQHDGHYDLDGPDVVLSPKAAEVLTLAVHELATNAVKYGAFSVPDGRVTVRWATFEKRGVPWLGLDWIEGGAPPRAPADPAAPRRRGFGSELIEGRIPYELGGRGKVTIEPGGARCRLEFPLRDGASILETDAPRRAAVFGGGIDMAGDADLSGHRVLVVEDDYYLATDMARALGGAGAEVLGPCPSEDAALDEMEETAPTAAVVDINLGKGPSFKLARELSARGIPFLFITGYDEAVIPPEFAGVARLQKPVDLGGVVRALTILPGSSGA